MFLATGGSEHLSNYHEGVNRFLSKREVRLYWRMVGLIEDIAERRSPEGNAWSVGGGPSASWSPRFERVVGEWIEAEGYTLDLIEAIVIRDVIGRYRRYRALGWVSVVLALCCYVRSFSTIHQSMSFYFLVAGSLGVVSALIFGVNLPGKIALTLYNESYWSLGNPLLVKVLKGTLGGGGLKLGARLREELCWCRAWLGLSSEGYDILNALAGEWELDVKELLDTSMSLSA